MVRPKQNRGGAKLTVTLGFGENRRQNDTSSSDNLAPGGSLLMLYGG
jgi:hypothetical protein